MAPSNITTYMKFIARFLLFIFIINTAKAQDSTIFISDPIDITQDGWNKVLQLSNGNTMLFHFEKRKGILVKVYDKTHKEISSKKHVPEILDINTLERTFFDALVEVNNEALLFVTQDIDNNETLIRLRYDGETGRFLGEEKVIKSQSFLKKTSTYVLTREGASDYAIFCYMSLPTDTITEVKLIRYNDKHQMIAEVPYTVRSKAYDNINFISAEMDQSGDIMTTLQLAKIIQYPVLYDYTYVLLYMPKDENKFVYSEVKMPTNMKVVNAKFTVNKFADNINMITTKEWLSAETKGLKNETVGSILQGMYIFPKDFSAVSSASFSCTKANEYIRKHIDSNASKYYGTIIDQNTDDRGITTVVFESKSMPESLYEKWIKYSPRAAGNLCVTKLDDKGDEIWATVIPKTHYYVQMESKPVVFYSKNTQDLFSTVSLNTSKNHYILYNESEENFKKADFEKQSQVFDYTTTNAVLYNINRKNIVTKRHFFSGNTDGQFMHIYPGSQSFHKANKILAIMMRKKAGKAESLHIAWRKMED